MNPSESLIRYKQTSRATVKTFVCVSFIALLIGSNGCMTTNAVNKAKEPTRHPLYDRVDHIEKAVLRDGTLLIFLHGQLSNSPVKTEFTLSVTLTNMETYQAIGNIPEYCEVKVSRDAIHEGWRPEILSVDKYIIIPIGPPIHQDAYPEMPANYAKSAKLLPNTTQTLYPLAQYEARGSLAMEFIFVDKTARQAYTVIHVDQVTVTKPTQKGYYALLPLAVPLDIAMSPFYLMFYLAFICGGVEMH